MKTILLILSLVTILGAATANDYYKEINNMTVNQKKMMLRAYIYGYKQNYGYTLTAIAWKESSFGVFKLNTHDGHKLKYKGSYGVFHILLNSVMMKENNKSHWHASRIAEKLYNDTKYCAGKSLEELLYWQRYWKNKNVTKVFSHTVGSYNQGTVSINSIKGNLYAKDILLRISALKKYFKAHNINELLK